MSTSYDELQAIGKGAAECIAEMVAALECDYDRLAELREHKADWIKENPGKFLDPNDTRSNYSLANPDEAEELAELEEAAGDCGDRDDAERRIQEHPLSIEMRGAWYGYGTEPADAGRPVEFKILLSTGGPATEILGELDEHGQPRRAYIQAQDWGTPWTDCPKAIDQDTLLTYCRCFYFGEG
jgi:hypothetical protein